MFGSAMALLRRSFNDGASVEELDRLFGELVREISAADPGWTADRMRCVDGSIFYRGDLGASVILTRDREIWVGPTLPGMINATGRDFVDGVLLFQPPRLGPPGKRFAP